MSLKPAIELIIGKTVESVVLHERDLNTRAPSQVFLVFTDGTYYELYGTDINCCGSLDPRGGIKAALDYTRLFPGGTITCYTRETEEECFQ
jgi:hypothetical protein